MDETLAWLKVYNAKCQPPWSDKELAHKAKDAAKAKHEKPRGYLLDASIADQRAEPDWTLPTKPHASGKIPTTLTTVNSNLRARAYNMDSQPIGVHPVIPRARKSENNVVNVVKMAHHSLAGPKIDQRATDKTATDLVDQLRRFKADGSSAPATARFCSIYRPCDSRYSCLAQNSNCNHWCGRVFRLDVQPPHRHAHAPSGRVMRSAVPGGRQPRVSRPPADFSLPANLLKALWPILMLPESGLVLALNHLLAGKMFFFTAHRITRTGRCGSGPKKRSRMDDSSPRRTRFTPEPGFYRHSAAIRAPAAGPGIAQQVGRLGFQRSI